MALRNIVTKEDKILYKVCRPVVKFNDRLHQLLDDMADTLSDAGGVGLAAPQVGVLRRAVLVLETNVEEDEDEFIIELINPEITDEEGAQCDLEGCLSLPGKQGYTIRPKTVKVKAQNRDGNWCVYKGSDLKAKAFCHEIDHLDGILYTDKLASQEEIDSFKNAKE